MSSDLNLYYLNKRVQSLEYCLKDLTSNFKYVLNDANKYENFSELMIAYLTFYECFMQDKIVDKYDRKFSEDYENFTEAYDRLKRTLIPYEDEVEDEDDMQADSKGGRKTRKTRKTKVNNRKIYKKNIKNKTRKQKQPKLIN